MTVYVVILTLLEAARVSEEGPVMNGVEKESPKTGTLIN